MPLSRLTCHRPFRPLASRSIIRMASTIVGSSGRKYIQGEVLQRHHHDPKLGVFKAKYI